MIRPAFSLIIFVALISFFVACDDSDSGGPVDTSTGSDTGGSDDTSNTDDTTTSDTGGSDVGSDVTLDTRDAGEGDAPADFGDTGAVAADGGIAGCDPTDWEPAWATVEIELIDAINTARAAGGTCGAETFDPAPALDLDPQLRAAARCHVWDMAQTGDFSHEGSDGSIFGTRANELFDGSVSSVDLGAGQAGVQAMVDAWLDNENSCRGLLEPGVTHMGVAYRADGGNLDFEPVWARVFGTL